MNSILNSSTAATIRLFKGRYHAVVRELTQNIPEVDVLLNLEPEELGAKLLFLLRRRSFDRSMFTPYSMNLELWDDFSRSHQPNPYPREQQPAVDVALTEAWAWLEAQGLIVPADNLNGRNGWRILSRRAKRFESESEFAQYTVARMLPKEALHKKLADKVWMAFMRSEFDVAVLQAMKAVEVSVRKAAGLGNNLVGVALMQEAFSPERGTLTDKNAEGGEKVGRMQLFAGAIGSYKNPQSHRDVDLNDPAEAMEIILLANHLLRIVDAREKAKGASA